MSRLKRFTVLAIILLFAVLPLYELADIGEHWPHDGDIVQIVLFLLFIVGISFLCRGIARVCVEAARRRLTSPVVVSDVARRRAVITPGRSGLFLIFCDFRL